MQTEEIQALWAEVEAQGYLVEMVFARMFAGMAEADSIAFKAALVTRRPWTLEAGPPQDAAAAQAQHDRMMERLERLVGLIAHREAAIRQGPPHGWRPPVPAAANTP